MKTGLKACLSLAIATAAVAPPALGNPRRITLTPKNIPKNPFVINDGQLPTPQQYTGPMFVLSHAWPTAAPPPMTNAPWVQAINNAPIDTTNAGAYVAALKKYVTPNARELILNFKNWDAAKAGWYNEPWLGTIRESIHGTYEAGQFPPSTFPGTGLKTTFDTHVLTYYDARAAYTLNKFWGVSAMKPDIVTANAQFEEGAVIVKAAVFASDDPKVLTNWWDAAAGAAEWPLFVSVPEQTTPPPAPMVMTGYVMQFDIIVKDTKSSPKTGWVFSTLVFDTSAPGDAWDKMVPLGAMWGNDPDVNSAANPKAPLKENWINPKAPLYSTQTLGWGGRLSGPNDGALNDIVVDGTLMQNVADSSCMSCHAPSEWNVAMHKQQSFLLPSYPSTAKGGPPFKTCGANQDMCSPAPGSPDWMRWFQDRPGTQPQDPGSVALDYDEVFAFKTLEMWWAATGPANQPSPFLILRGRTASTGERRFNAYTGAPVPKRPASH